MSGYYGVAKQLAGHQRASRCARAAPARQTNRLIIIICCYIGVKNKNQSNFRFASAINQVASWLILKLTEWLVKNRMSATQLISKLTDLKSVKNRMRF